MAGSTLEDVVAHAFAVGLTFWDTALVYGMGRSEKVVGGLLRGHDRASYQVSTKFRPQAASQSETAVKEMLEQSLTNIGCETIDLYWIHNPANVALWTPHLIPLLESGKIKHVGVSNHNLAQIREADAILREAGFRISAIQNHYSLLYRSSERAGLLDFCHKHKIAFFSYMVLEQGALTGNYSPENPLPEGSQRAKIYNALLPYIAKRYEAKAADIAVAWAIAKGTVPIVGVTKTYQVDSLAKVAAINLSASEIDLLEKLSDEAGVDTRGFWEEDMQVQGQ
ncbi:MULTISPECIES: aldo/keto reductase [unclassified Asaia]|uniref:aldo/keto reductase n=1 Tax=unclassified Asaia TaxID=2685023 RepID=UPI0018F4E054|nr:aldo/keto reductase [Asaia sp. W19]